MNMGKSKETHGKMEVEPLLNVYTKNWKDPPFPMGKTTVSIAIFNSYVAMLVSQRVYHSYVIGMEWVYTKQPRYVMQCNTWDVMGM